jgi:excinuclease ABC subunit C
MAGVGSERDDAGRMLQGPGPGADAPAGRDERPGALEERLASVPAAPGVYLLKDAHGKVIYVGKAISLRSRIRSYLRGGDDRSQVRFLVGKLADFETVVTANEKEALILENNLIKQYRPRYNIRLKDDKSYVSVKVTVREPWPRVLVTRRIVKDGSRYFGPFHSASAVRETLDTIRKIFPLRTCSDGVFRNRARPCIEYDIKRCLAPCVLAVDRAAYDEHLRQAMALLEGRSREVATALRCRMEEAAAAERFEEAARLRDQVRAIEKTQERQQVVSHWGADQDVFGLYREGGAIEVEVLFVRDGKLVSTQAHAFDDWELPDGDVLEAVLTQFYQATARAVPDEILLPAEISDAAVRMEYLAERRGRRVTIAVPRRGDKLRLVEMAQANARQSFAERRDAAAEGQRQVAELQRRLGLPRPPHRIECLDIATLQGGETVGAVVAFADGRPWKDGYRRFRIRSVEGTDDFAAVAEVLSRRFREGARRGERPDLLVIDGGLGQLGAATAALETLQLGALPVIGLAKERVARDPVAREIQRRPDRVFLPGRKNPVVLRSNSTALFLLQRVRDEAHRFANTYHRTLRSRARLRSLLDTVDGVGPRRRRALLRHFGSVKRVQAASREELMAVPGVSAQLADRIKQRLAPA